MHDGPIGIQAVGQLDAAQPPPQLQIASVAELPGPRRFGTADASGGTSTPAERNATQPSRPAAFVDRRILIATQWVCPSLMAKLRRL